MRAIILAGGFGSRLQSVVADVPKPLAPVAGKPFLAWLIEALHAGGIEEITLSVHHQWEKIRDYFDRHPAPVALHYVVEKAPLGTGGAMAYALKAVPGAPVIVANGDTFVKVGYRRLYAHHMKNKARLTMVLREVTDTGRYGEVTVENGIVTGFQAGRAGKPGLINAGIYVIDPALFMPFALPQAFSFEQDFLTKHVGEVKPQAFIADDYFIDIGIPEDYARAGRELPEAIAC